jgi:hypothetical protein
MPIAFINGIGATNAASGTTLTTGSYTVTAGSLLVAVWRHNHDNVSGSGTPIVNISDSRGNTWTSADSATQGIANAQDGWRVGIAYAMNAIAASTTFTFTISDSRSARGIAVLEYSGAAALSATGKFQPTALDTGARPTIVSSAYSTSGPTLTVVVASTISGANLADWTGITVAGNATTGRSPANYDTSAYIRDYISTGAFSSVTSSASNNNGGIGKTIVSASFAEATPILYTAIDETVSDRNDYIKSSTRGQVYQTTLQPVSRPGAGTNIDFNFDANSPTDSGSIKFDLLSGSKLIKSRTVSLSRNWAARLPPRVPAVSPQPLGLGEWPRINIGDPIARDISSVTLGGRPNIYQLAVALPDGRVTTTNEGNAGAWGNNERVFDKKYGYGSKALDAISWGSSGSFGISLPSVNSPNTTGLTMMYIGSVRNLSGASGEYSLMTIYGLGAGGGTQFIILNNSGGVKNKLRTSVWARTGTYYQSSTVDFPANRVVCIVATHHKSQGQKLYIDGKLAASQAGSAGLDIQQYVDVVNYVLIRGNDGSHDATHMTATWNRCLSASEVQSLFENPYRLVRSLPARAVCFPSPAQTTFPITPSDYSAIGSWPWTPTLRVTSQ